MTEEEVNTPRPPDSSLQQAAIDALQDSIEELLSDETNSDLRPLLPDEFASELISLAWRHQFDLDKARFRRDIKTYFSILAQSKDTEQGI
jgi:hypothetical protein